MLIMKHLIWKLPSLFLILLSAVVLIGWKIKLRYLVQADPSFVPIVFNSGLCFLLLGLGLSIPANSLVRTRIILGSIIILLCGLTAMQDILNLNIGIDELFAKVWFDYPTPHNGRMTLNNITGFILCGLIFILLPFANKTIIAIGIEILIFLVGLIGITALTGYLFNVEFLYSWYSYSRMSPITAIAFILVFITYWHDWIKNPYHSVWYSGREDKKIILISSIILFSIVLLVSLISILIIARQETVSIGKQLQQELNTKKAIFLDAMLHSFAEIDAIRTEKSFQQAFSNSSDQTGRQSFLKLFLSEGFSAVSFYDRNGNLIDSYGKFVEKPEVQFNLKFAQQALLLWSNGWHLQTITKIDPIINKGFIRAEWPLDTRMMNRDELNSTQTIICAPRDEKNAYCVSSDLNPPVFNLSREVFNQSTSVDYALAGYSDILKSYDQKQHHVLTAFSPIGASGLVMMMQIDYNQIYQPILQDIYIVIPIILLAMLIGELLLRMAVIPLVRKAINAEKELLDINKQLHESQERYNYALKSSQAGLWDWEAGTERMYYSPYMKKMLGFTEKEFPNVFSSFESKLHPDDKEKTLELMQQHLEKNTTYNIEFRLKTKSGEYRWFQAIGQSLLDHQNNVIRMAGSIIDITDRKKIQSRQEVVEKELRESEAHKSAILESAYDSIITINNGGQILSCNLQTAKMFHYSEFELLTKNIEELVPGVIEKISHKEYKLPTEYLANLKNGEIFAAELTISEMKIHSENRFVIIIRDITERKKVDKLKQEFISVVSHELRTPITSINGSLALILGGAVGDCSEKIRKLLNIASKNCERLIMLINDILDVEKIEEGKMVFKLEMIDINELVKEAVAANQMYAEKFFVKLLFSESNLILKVNVDCNRLIQVLNNLISNAAKFSPAGEVVSISIMAHQNIVRVSISDKGPGIAENFKKNIFKKFSQGDSSNTREKGGTGLGLSISKAIIEKFGGVLNFSSTASRGATFYFDLPLCQPEIKKNETEPLIHYKAELLVCEDDKDQANYLAALLKADGYYVDIANTVAEAKQYLAKRKYSALLLDLILPDKDGIAFIRELRSFDATRDLDIIVVSVMSEIGQALLNGDALSIIDWLDKPVDFDKLLYAVKRIKIQHELEKPSILHIEDDYDIHAVVAEALRGEANIFGVDTLKMAKEKLAQSKFDLVILDLVLPDGNGVELLPLLMKKQLPVLVFSAVELDKDFAKYVSEVLVKSETTTEQLLDRIHCFLSKNISIGVQSCQDKL